MLAIAEQQLADIRPTQVRFLQALTECGSITEAAHRVGIDRSSHYDWLAAEGHRGLLTDDGAIEAGTYAHAFLRAKQVAADRILERSEQHALSDDTTMPAVINRIFQIKRWYPQYRDQLTVKSTSMNISARVDLNQLDPMERAELLRLTQRRLLLLESDVAPPPEDER